jgi:hypothetical protein
MVRGKLEIAAPEMTKQKRGTRSARQRNGEISVRVDTERIESDRLTTRKNRLVHLTQGEKRPARQEIWPVDFRIQRTCPVGGQQRTSRLPHTLEAPAQQNPGDRRIWLLFNRLRQKGCRLPESFNLHPFEPRAQMISRRHT